MHFSIPLTSIDDALNLDVLPCCEVVHLAGAAVYHIARLLHECRGRHGDTASAHARAITLAAAGFGRRTRSRRGVGDERVTAILEGGELHSAGGRTHRH